MQRFAAALLVVATAVALTTCRGTEAIGPAVPASAASVFGNHQTGIAGHVLPQPLTVLVTTATGTGVAGVLVHWTITAGTGSLSADAVATDSLGHSSVTLTLGPNATQHDTVTGTVDGLPSVVFSFSATADVAAQLTLVSGDAQHGPAGQPLPAPLVVETRDQFGNPTTGTAIAWSVTAGNGSLSATTTTTDSTGRAAVTWTVGSTVGAGSDRVTASATGLAGSPAQFGASADPGPVASLSLVSGNGQTATVATTLTDSLVVLARDQFGNVVSSVAVQWATAAGDGSVSLSSVLTDAAGRSAIRWTLGSSAGAQHASATVSGAAGSPIGFVAMALPAAPAELAFTAQPLDATAGAILTTVEVAILDAFGNAVTSATDGVTLTLATNPPGASLGGTTLEASVGGVATFADLHIEKAAAGYALQASAPGLTAAVSTTFTIVAGSATQCVFSGQPSDGSVGSPMNPSLRVDALDAFDNLATSYAGNVTLTLAANPGGATLLGTLITTAVAGSAVFSNVSLDKPASGYTLAAACSGLPGATSAPFDMAAGLASHLQFTTQPATTGASAPIAPPVQVTALDVLDNVATSFTGSVTIAIGTNPTGGVLSGTTTVSAVSGVATFPDLHIDKSGSGYTLTAAATTLPAATSSTFDITTAPTTLLTFSTQPTNATAGSTIAPAVKVTAQDGLGNTVTSFTGNVTIAIATNPGAGTLSGTLTVAAVGGVATFTNLSINRTGSGYALIATAGSLGAASSAPFDITAGTVSATQSTITASPGTITASSGSSASAITVTAKDALGNLVPGATVVLAASGSGNTLVQPAAPTNPSGVATGSLGATTAGPKTVSATINGVAINQTSTVTVIPSAAAALFFTGQPTNTVAAGVISGGAGGVVVTVRDAFGNTATGFVAGVTMAIGTNPGSGTLSGTLTRSAVSGVATFSNLSIDKAGSAYVLVATASSLPSASSAAFNITAGAISATKSTVVSAPGSIAASNGTSASTITVTAKDALGNPVSAATVVLAASGSGNTLVQPAAPTNASGVATGSLSATTAASKTVSATINGVAITQTASVIVTSAAATVLVFTTQPTNTAATAAINGSTGGVVVTARDAFGNTATAFTAGVTMDIGTNPSGATLSGTLTRSAVAGIATFTNLSIDAPGTGYKLRATSGTLTAAQSSAFNVTGASVVVAAGAGQTGLKAFALNVPPAVLVRDAANAPLANMEVTFQVAGGGGSVTGAVATTDANGIATLGSWTVQLGSNTLTATVTGSGITGNPVTFTATGVNGAYHIDLRFLTSMSASRQAAFTNAAARWETIVYGDVPNIAVDVPAGFCGSNAPRLHETVDDIVIYATVDSIDGPSEILGAAGPCGLRSSGNLPFVGAMIFDSADVAQLESDGQFDEVILHEMGHVLGYGTVWTDLNLLKNGGTAASHFSGAQSILAFDRSGGQAFSGAKVPVENCVGFPPGVCGAGTQDSHWREVVLVSELMTGFIDAGANPLSVITTASMGDLGYTVNYAASDPYAVVNPVAAVQGQPRPSRELKHDILRLPVMVADATGRVLEVHAPR